jgi:hypothetical protein
MILLVFFICTQIEVNDIVGFEINSMEARKYHLFTDIVEFEAAWFYKDDDSITVEILYLQDGERKDSTVSIDLETFKTLNSYIRNYRLIIEDEQFRLSFIETFKIDWPVVSRTEIEQAARAASDRRRTHTACCMTGACAIGAYAAALLTRDIRTEHDTLAIGIPCWTGDNTWTCVGIPIPITREYYSINPVAYIGGAAVGSGVGYFVSKKTYTPNQILFDALARDVVAFDHAGYPITEQEITAANKGTNEALFGTMGLAVGLAGAGVTTFFLYSPWSDKIAEKDWHRLAIETPIVVISGTGLVLITRYLMRKGRQFDRRATIERLKGRNIEK